MLFKEYQALSILNLVADKLDFDGVTLYLSMIF
jgi:hypothetical protein